MRPADLAGGGAALLLAVGVCAGALAMPMGSLRDPGPAFLPFWVGVTLGLMSLGLIARALARSGRNTAEGGGAGRAVAVTVAGLVGYAAALGALGYLLATFVLLVLLLRALGERRWWAVLLFAALVAGGSWALFDLWLGVPLPAGTPLASR